MRRKQLFKSKEKENYFGNYLVSTLVITLGNK